MVGRDFTILQQQDGAPGLYTWDGLVCYNSCQVQRLLKVWSESREGAKAILEMDGESQKFSPGTSQA